MAFTEAEVGEMISEVLAETQWEEKQQTVREFMVDFGSAQPIQLVPQGPDLNLQPCDLLHPFLAFSRRRRTKVYAENLVWDQKAKRYDVQGPPLEIPKDYLGWFEVVRQGAPPNQAQHMTIGSTVKTKCKQILLRTTVVAYLEEEEASEEGGDFQLGSEVRMYPGELLHVQELVSKKWRMQPIGDASNVKAKESETKFLKFTDRQERTAYVSLAHPGQFFALWDPDMKSKTPRMDMVYYIYDLINFGFPLLARVVFGWPPVDFPEFSGFMRLLGLNRPDSVILRSLKPTGCVIIELPMDSDVMVEKMKNPEYLIKNQTFERLLEHSCDRIYPYLIGMKHMDTKYPVLPVASTSNGDDNGNNHSKSGEPPSKSRDMCRMARPREMKEFNPLDIFPPLDEPTKHVSDTWTLSFKDPDFHSGKLGDLKTVETMTIDPDSTQIGGYSQLADSRQTSIIGSVQSALKGLKTTDGPARSSRHESIWNRRSDMEQVLLEREAEC